VDSACITLDTMYVSTLERYNALTARYQWIRSVWIHLG